MTFRSLFGDVPLRIRQFENCPCREVLLKEPRSFSALTLEGGMAPNLAYVTAKFAALASFGKVADLLAELLPVGGAVNAGTVRNRTRPVGERIARLRPDGASDPEIDAVIPAVVIGLDGGYLHSRHRRPERNFEVIAGKVLKISIDPSIASPLLAMAIGERICQRDCERRYPSRRTGDGSLGWGRRVVEVAASGHAEGDARSRLVAHRDAL